MKISIVKAICIVDDRVPSSLFIVKSGFEGEYLAMYEDPGSFPGIPNDAYGVSYYNTNELKSHFPDITDEVIENLNKGELE